MSKFESIQALEIKEFYIENKNKLLSDTIKFERLEFTPDKY